MISKILGFIIVAPIILLMFGGLLGAIQYAKNIGCFGRKKRKDED